YHSVVMQKGNPVAQAMIEEVYEVCDDVWRGIGVIPNSGLALKGEYAAYDVELALPINLDKPSLDPKGCQCGRVLQGLGACMVSVEGSCAAWYKYGYSSGGSTWED
ncbi:MAG: hydrogenase formation protein HypD, partial [Veillonella sp.]|nr:hydrogenase formation protein HypD [Veillonella sp.]